MFTGGELVFNGDELIFKGGEHKFTARKHKIISALLICLRNMLSYMWDVCSYTSVGYIVTSRVVQCYF